MSGAGMWAGPPSPSRTRHLARALGCPKEAARPSHLPAPPSGDTRGLLRKKETQRYFLKRAAERSRRGAVSHLSRLIGANKQRTLNSGHVNTDVPRSNQPLNGGLIFSAITSLHFELLPLHESHSREIKIISLEEHLQEH